MAVPTFEKVCNYYGVSKVTYLASATLFTAGLIVECILVYLVVIPYAAEQRFANANCTYLTGAHNHDLTKQKCENKCTKEESHFPCLFIRVYYRNKARKWNIGFLYDNFRTYSRHRKNRCSTMPCLALPDDNKRWVMAFNETLHERRNFSCYYNEAKPSELLLYKLQSSTVVLNCIVWPCSLICGGLLCIMLTWYCAGCKIWAMDKTVIA